jgi:dipeptidyl aminopeptidase/acylaminoacyl peptidase
LYEYLAIDSPEPGFGEQILVENPDRWEVMNPYERLDDATVVNALLIQGRRDKTVSPESTERFAAALETGGADVAAHFLPDAGHMLTTSPWDRIAELDECRRHRR